MKLTKDEQAVFDHLSKGETGRQLAKIMERLINDVYDVRTWDEAMTKEAARLAAQRLEYLKMKFEHKQLKDLDPDLYI